MDTRAIKLGPPERPPFHLLESCLLLILVELDVAVGWIARHYFEFGAHWNICPHQFESSIVHPRNWFFSSVSSGNNALICNGQCTHRTEVIQHGDRITLGNPIMEQRVFPVTSNSQHRTRSAVNLTITPMSRLGLGHQ